MPYNIIGSTVHDYSTQLLVNGKPVGVGMNNPSLAKLIETWLRNAVDEIAKHAHTGGVNGRDRDRGGKVVRDAWILWAMDQDDPKPSWLVPYDQLEEEDKEADRQIYDAVMRDLERSRGE